MANKAKGLLACCALLLCIVAQDVDAQTKRTEHTYKLDDPDVRPAATLEDARWLVGSWLGSGFGQRFESVWNPPSAGSMVGMFKLYKDDAVSFYELLLLVEEQGSLTLKVKHFTPEFVAWEDKPDYISFRRRDPLLRAQLLPCRRENDGRLHRDAERCGHP